MRAGTLNKKIDIMHIVSSQSSLGEPVVTWSTYIANRWANVRPLQGRELFAAQTIETNTEYVFTIRYTTGIDETMRIKYNGLEYSINNLIDAGEERRELQIYCARMST